MSEISTHDDGNWFLSKDRKFVDIAMEGELRDGISRALPELMKKFKPEECADIVLAGLRSLLENPKTKENIIKWVQDNSDDSKIFEKS